MLTSNKIKQRILDAGFTYPAHWDEMGSSEKDLWEDRKLAEIDHRETMQSTVSDHD